MDLRQALESHALFEHTKIGDLTQLRTEGLIKHINSEMEKEIKKDPTSVEEWCDVAILAFCGALRAAAFTENREHLEFSREPTLTELCSASAQIVSVAFQRKLQKCWFIRKWPKNTPEDSPCEHVKSNEAAQCCIALATDWWKI